MGQPEVVEVSHHRSQRGDPGGPLGRIGQGPGGPGLGADELGVERLAPFGSVGQIDEAHDTGMVDPSEQLRFAFEFCGVRRADLLHRDQLLTATADSHRGHCSPSLAQDQRFQKNTT